ncbi:MAG TPA: VWA domain-containing protein [Thermoanaerobaculia bacterium]|jgi:Ca-activated chloride channel family protein
MSFAAPGLLWLLAVAPLAAVLALWLLRRRRQAESAWIGGALAPRLRTGGAPRPAWIVAGWLALALLGLALALARPRWGTASETVERRGLDLVFVLDTSLSMNAADVAPSRFWLAQSLVRRLVAAMPGNRVALVAAEGEGEVLTPLTVDGAVVDLVLDGLAPGTLSLPGTRLARALERAVMLFPESGETHRAIVVLSDGEDHGGELDHAVDVVRAASATLFAVGVGSRRGAPVPVPGAPESFKRDARGEVVVSRLQPDNLRRLADGTGGEYFEAAGAAFDPAPVARRIAALGGRAIESTTVTSLEERFQWPLALAVAALLTALLFTPWSPPPTEIGS